MKSDSRQRRNNELLGERRVALGRVDAIGHVVQLEDALGLGA